MPARVASKNIHQGEGKTGSPGAPVVTVMSKRPKENEWVSFFFHDYFGHDDKYQPHDFMRDSQCTTANWGKKNIYSLVCSKSF